MNNRAHCSFERSTDNPNNLIDCKIVPAFVSGLYYRSFAHFGNSLANISSFNVDKFTLLIDNF